MTIRTIQIVGGAMLIISALFLPWVSVTLLGGLRLLQLYDFLQNLSNLTESGTGGAGVVLIIFILIICSGLLVVFKKPRLGGWLAIIGCILAFLNVMSASRSLGISGFSLLASGFYIALIGGFISIFAKNIHSNLFLNNSSKK